ncbi:PREDICTED: serine palmitoyltransferase small subunit A-like [Chrysochloris asiatica]|uniref:Serine palmitoyltransferase small subunit A-like n=1 Tax=Chrysochloris asiatica TaxID=185453 RepID=A0A9B0UA23_CHRAS|nr:PREDICTED: serine palmitoyltransferase small subunit A-like [Chrysochloris asiatica]
MAGMALARAWKQMSWFFYQYLLVTAFYMLEPWERTVFNSMLVSVVGMALYTGYVFMPQHIMAILHYFEIHGIRKSMLRNLEKIIKDEKRESSTAKHQDLRTRSSGKITNRSGRLKCEKNHSVNKDSGTGYRWKE